MKKLLYLIIIQFVLLSCEDNRFDWRESKPDKVYLPKYGLQIEDAYAIGENAEAMLWAYKGGYSGTYCQVTYTIDETILDEYNSANFTSYEILPSSCYDIPSYTVEIPGKKQYGYFSVNYSPEKIVELCGGQYGVEKYALPIRISSNLETTDQNSAIIVFNVKEPIVKMLSKETDELKFDYGSEEVVMQHVDFGMSFQSKWSCSYALETDETVLKQELEAYNERNQTYYALLPKEAYTLSATEGTIRAGADKESIEITIDPSKCGNSGLYAIPVKLASVGSPLQVSETDRLCIVPIVCTGNYIGKTGWTVKCSSDNPNVAASAPEHLIDGDIKTFWHPTGKDFPQFGESKDPLPTATVDLKQSVCVSCFEIDHRQDQFYPQYLTNLRCSVSVDGNDFTEVGFVPVPWTANNKKCTVHVPPTIGRFVQFTIEYANASFAFAELSIRGEVVE